uniref:Uncharacterized protein n=1 Tax=Panagrolaimus sp. PS1159 TaxID=55785 RepID=A0AC35GGX8_9BILA
MKSYICKCSNGLHLASAIIDSKIWIVGKKNWVKTFVCSVDIISMKLQIFKVFENRNALFSPLIPCHKCIMPYIRNYESNPLRFLIVPNRVITKKPHNIIIFTFTINSLHQSCFFEYHGERYIRDTIMSNIAINDGNEILYANKNSINGRIENFSIVNGRMHREKSNKFKKWEDVAFFNDGGTSYCLAKFFKHDNVRIGLFSVRFSYGLNRIKFTGLFNFTVDSNFPSFDMSSIFVSPNFFVFQSSQAIVTIPKRMLSLSESAYISLCKIPERPKPEVKISFLEKIKRFFFKNKSKPWMSLSFIIESLKLSPSFSLIHVTSDFEYC